jgi:hypothetical protein
MINSRLDRIASVLVTAGLVFAAVTATAGVARADDEGTMPKGCYATGVKPTQATVGKQTKEVHFAGKGGCGEAYKDFVRLVHNYDGFPDVQVTERTDFGTSFGRTGNTCDGGGTTQYYSEAGWDTYVDVIEDTTWQRVQRVSGIAKFAHC